MPGISVGQTLVRLGSRRQSLAAQAYTASAAVVDTPDDVTGLVGWYDFSDISTLWKDTGRTSAVTSDADEIKGVTDKSGTGHHLSEATKPPVYKVSIQNSLAIARFTSDLRLAAGAFTLDQPATYFVVLNPTELGDNKYVFDGNTANSQAVYHPAGFAGLALYAGSAGPQVAWGAGFSIFTIVFNGASSTIRLDAGGAVTGDAGAGNAGGLHVASAGDVTAFPVSADFGEFCAYSGAVSAGDQTSIRTYLKSKWGTP